LEAASTARLATSIDSRLKTPLVTNELLLLTPIKL
jgi:hypothetical protein